MKDQLTGNNPKGAGMNLKGQDPVPEMGTTDAIEDGKKIAKRGTEKTVAHEGKKSISEKANSFLTKGAREKAEKVGEETMSRVAMKQAYAKAGGKIASKIIPGASLALGAGFVANDLKHGKKGSAIVDAIGMTGGLGGAASIGLSALGVDRLGDKLLDGKSIKASKYPGDPKANKEAIKAKHAGKDQMSIGKKLLEDYKKLGKGNLVTTIAIGAALFAGVSSLLGIGKDASAQKTAGPSL